MSSRIKNDLIGVVVILVAVILMIAVLIPGDAVLTSWIASALGNGFGIGSVLLPIEIALFGACFFFLGRHEIVLPRVAIGLAIIFIAIISIAGVCMPGAADSPQSLLDESVVAYYGGWVGNGIAYGLLELVGSIVSWVILIAMIAAGLILIGFSISGIIDRLSEGRDRRSRRMELELENEEPSRPISPYARAHMRQVGSGAFAAGEDGVTTPLADGATQVWAKDPEQHISDHTVTIADDAKPSSFVPMTQVLGGGRQQSEGGQATQVLGTEDEGGSSDSAMSMLDGEWQSEQPTTVGSLSFEPLPTIETLDIPDFIANDYPEVQHSDATDNVSDSTDVAQTAKTVGATTADDSIDAAAAGVIAGAAAAGAAIAGAASRSGARDETDSQEQGELKSNQQQTRKKQKEPESDFKLPSFKMIRKSSRTLRSNSTNAELAELGAKLQETLHEFNIDAEVVGWTHGPTVTLFKVSLASGVRVNKITALADDIGLAFASQSVRIFSPIAGTSLVGIEIPNDARDNVLLGDVLPPAGEKPLLLAIGKDVEGNSITADLAKMPHLLIGGTTGSGKSVAINSMIMSVLMRATPEEVRMILVDPKRVELSLYNDIPHLFVPVVTDPHKAASTLAWAVTEMDRRLKLFEEVGARNLSQYTKLRAQHNAEVARRARIREESRTRFEEELQRRRDEMELQEVLAADGWSDDGSDEEDAGQTDGDVPADEGALGEEPVWTDPFEGDDFDDEDWEGIPSIMIVIDELSDLMMVAGKEVETSICRIAQLARAAGIHLIVATQRPSANVITGLIKANITNRIAFNVASGTDSRVILDTTGAEHLVGLGDMLFSKPEYGKPLRIQGCFVGEDEINDVCNFLKSQGSPDYHNDIFSSQAVHVLEGGSTGAGDSSGDDALVWEAAEIVVGSQLGSTSALQRRLKVGYARAGRIMDMLEDRGIVGPANGSKPRDVYIDDLVELENVRSMWENGML